jgi:SsrA-binding protein
MGKGSKIAKDGRKIVAQNRRARHDYELFEHFEAGLVLVGSEVKSLRDGNAQLVDGYVEIRNGEAWLVGINIAQYSYSSWANHEPKRDRKLLLHAKELKRLDTKTREKGFTIVPLELYFKDGLAKIEIALARGRKSYDKRDKIEAKDEARMARGRHDD